MPRGSGYAGRNFQIDRKRCQSALKRDTKAPGERFTALRGLILCVIKHRYVCCSQIEMVLHRFFCMKNPSNHRPFLSTHVQLMHNHRASFYVPARFFHSMSQSSIFGKYVDFPPTHQNYILHPQPIAPMDYSHAKKKIPCKNRPQAAYRVFSSEPYVIRQNIIPARTQLQAPF